MARTAAVSSARTRSRSSARSTHRWWTWSGDETFRLAMNVALGYPLETPWQDMAWSSNSAMVMIAAANFLADHAAEAGHPEDEAPLRDRADRARVIGALTSRAAATAC